MYIVSTAFRMFLCNTCLLEAEMADARQDMENRIRDFHVEAQDFFWDTLLPFWSCIVFFFFSQFCIILN